MLHLPDPTKPYYMQTDASDFCGAGRVFQKDEEGDEKILAWVSRMFTKTEHTYNTVKKEVLVLLYTLKTMDFFLRFAAKIIILVDAQAIQFLRMCRESTGILLRFSMELSLYNCKIHHFKGENNEISDIHSRYHPDIDQLKEDMKAEETTGVYKSRWLEKTNKLKKILKINVLIFFLLVCVSINVFVCDNNNPQGHPGGPGLKEVFGKSKNCEFSYFFVLILKVRIESGEES